jgi:hypothetical protein
MNYNDLILLGCGVGGVLVHNLMKIQDLKKANKFIGRTYFGMEWPSIATSVIIVLIALVCKHQIAELENAGKWLAASFATIGYSGQSIFLKFIGRANKIMGDVEK